MQGEIIDGVVAYFVSLGKAYKSTLEKSIEFSKHLYPENEFLDLCKNSEKIDPILEIQGWTMEVASTEVLPQFNMTPKSYVSFTYCSLIKSSLTVPSKSSSS